jgi:mannose-6-phosphate isomerase
MYPIRFNPIYQDYIWGGERISKYFNRKTEHTRIAESWEISDREEGMSVVMNGKWKGKTLNQLVLEMGEDLLGAEQKFDRFPLLLKIIDAKENLSIQVHPDHGSAPILKGEPKTEMWVALAEASVYAGFIGDVTEKEFKKAIQAKKLDECLEKFDLQSGEAVYIPGGRVHAICAGSLLYEVQQNSNTTYRLYDWERTHRALHLEEGMKAIRWDDSSHAKLNPHHLSSDLHHQLVNLVSSPFFTVERLDVFDYLHIAAIAKTFQVFFCVQGTGTITVDSQSEPFEPGMTYLVPAASKVIEIEGRCQSLRVRLP